MTEKEIATNKLDKISMQIELDSFGSWYSEQCNQKGQNRLDRATFKEELTKRIKKIYNISSDVEIYNLLAFFDKMTNFNDSPKLRMFRN